MSQVINFSGVEEAKGGGMVKFGTIGVFKVKAIKFGTSPDKGTPYVEPEFVNADGESFRESFYLTDKALPKLQHLIVAATGNKAPDQLSYQQLEAMLMNKKVALKVHGNHVPAKGAVYPTLGFGGFAKPEDKLAELVFTASEQQEHERFAQIVASSSSSTADSESSGGNITPSDDNF